MQAGPTRRLEPFVGSAVLKEALCCQLSNLMRLDRFITLNLIRPLMGLRRLGLRTSHSALRAPRRLPILMYHSISDDPELGVHPYYRVCTSLRRFADQMQWLKDNGYHGVTLTAGLAWLNSQPSTHSSQLAGTPPPSLSSPKPVALTFDDGFGDFYTAAFPILLQHGFRASMFLPTAFVGDERRAFRPRGSLRLSTIRDCLTWSEVRELHAAGIQFGSHTVNHPKLVDLDWPEIESEISDSKSEIEQKLSHPVTAFCYPYAFPQAEKDFAETFSQLLKRVGFESCVTTEVGRAKVGDDPLRLKRLPINSCDDRRLSQAKLEGSYDWVGVPQRFVKQAKRVLRLQEVNPIRRHSTVNL